MDGDVLRMRAHIDQTRSEMRQALRELGKGELVEIIQTCAKGRLSDFDERTALLVGLLAVVAIFDLMEGA